MYTLRFMSAIVLFARSPEREAAEKRIRGGAGLFRSVIAAWLRAADACGAVPVIACEARDRAALAAIAPAVHRQWIEQEHGPFGARVAAAASVAFERGFGAVMLAAIDAPPPIDLAIALEALQRGTPVLAPARDGGINFIGLAQPDVELLEQFEIHRADLAQLCLAHLGDVVVFESATDLDSSTCLRFARREKSWRGYFAVSPVVFRSLAVHPSRGVTPSLFTRPPPAA